MRRSDLPDRRDFLRGALGVGTLVLAHGSLVASFAFSTDAHGRPVRVSAVVADLSLCTGCRTCETACAAFNHPVQVDGRTMVGLGNPHLSNIRVHAFLPEVDVSVTCALCADAPCVAACPIPEDEQGRRALYRHPELHTITNDTERCVSCGSCARACASERGGVIVQDPDSGRPTHMCTLCGGDPSCVDACPYGALRLERLPVDSELHGRPPEEIARAMMERWYTLEVSP